MTTAEEDVAGEELEPLFDYKRVQPAMTFRFDDSDLEKADIFKHCNKRAKVVAAEGDKAVEKGAAGAEKASKAVDVEEDWLAAPPPLPKPASRPMTEDSALQQLRLKKQELAKFAESAEDILRKLEETAKQEVGAKEKPEQIILDDESEPQAEKAREKIVISVQDKDDQQQFRIYKDDKFDKLFKVYAKKAKLHPSDLTFVFDGDKIDPASTPEGLDLEDNDMIEVSHKRRC